MRCPKCGFISFDHLEACKKCHKDLSAIIAEVNGTTYDTEPPMFLTIATMDKSAASAPPRPTDRSEEVPGREDAGTLAFVEHDEPFDLDEDEEAVEQRREIEFPGGNDGLVMEFDELEEGAPRDEFTLDLGGQDEEANEPALPSVDFGDLDISDLAPPIQTPTEPIRFEEQPAFHDTEPVAELSPIPSPTDPSSKTQAALEDLNFNGLDLDTPSKLITGSAAGKKFLPSVKTGTALDKFDIDLGDLFAETTEKK